MCGDFLMIVHHNYLFPTSKSENGAISWGPDPVDSVELGVARPSNFYQAPHELVLKVVLRAPMGFEAKPIELKPALAHLPFCLYNSGFL